MRCSLVLRFLITALFVLVFGWTGPANADLIYQGHEFSAITYDAIGITPFDPSLGTLDEVYVSIQGQTRLDFGADVYTDSYGNPLPYTFSVSVEQEFFGLAGKFFAFESPAIFLFSGVATGSGSFHSFLSPFTYNFIFDDTTDLLGFTVPQATGINMITPPSSISGLREDFIETIMPINEIDLVQQFSSISTFEEPYLMALSSEGSIIIEYDYTPSPAPVSEPATVLLLSSGLIGLVGFRRKFSKR
jgi:hypothetical protein